MLTAKQVQIALVLGVEMRSGTNYLFDLLGQHPQCGLARKTPEDFLVAESAYLDKYIRVLWSFWKKYTYSNLSLESLQVKAERLVHSIIADQVEEIGVSTIVSKTPYVAGLERLPTLFKHTKILFLMRDGRSVAYSLEKSFDCHFFKALCRWQSGAQEVIRFKLGYPEYYQSNCLLVRYEDLFNAPKDVLVKCFNFLGMDPSLYDYSYADKSKIIGSSDLRTTEASVHWRPIQRTDAFNPLERYKNWSTWKQRTSEIILDKELNFFGYKTQAPTGSPKDILGKALYRLYQTSQIFSRNYLKKFVRRLVLG